MALLCIEPTQLFDIGEDLLDCIRDRVRDFPAAKEILMRKPNGLLVSRAFGFGAGIHLAKVKRLFAAPTESREIGRVHGKERAFVHGFIEQPIARNAFELQSGDKRGARNFLAFSEKYLRT